MTLRRRQVWVGLAVIVAIPILVPLITLRSARARILGAASADLGRRLQADAVHLRLFPLPGVELDHVRLGEDPAFGLEDMVVADDATAAVRVGALLEGRLVFARIHLDRPSINLVRNRAGEWNITALLDRTGAALRGAATGGTGARARPEPFPYLEWSDARVNFKLGQTKQRVYLDDVQGSLARDGAGWRLQASFQPQRTDLNLSGTGDVTVDGRWPASGGGFHKRPFDLELRVQNSYLAGSSALLAGHDAGVHGILAAQIHVQGTGQQFQLSGAFQAQSLRRWDLLPPPATVNGTFAADYYPSQDRLALVGLGDPGFRHLRLAGEVDNLFTRPSADLALELRQLPAADLLPLVMAVKARLPAGLQADGEASGQARLHWAQGGNGGASYGGSARFQLTSLKLKADQRQLALPALSVAWDGHTLSLPPTPATLAASAAAPSTPLRLAASMDRAGFRFQLESPDFTAAAADALAQLLGLSSPWPPALAGHAAVKLALASPWTGFRAAGWSGEATFKQARFQPAGADRALALANVALRLGGAAPARVAFTAALPGAHADPIAGTVLWAPAAAVPVQFDLRAARLDDAALWRFLRPPPGDLVQRVLGDVTGDAGAAPPAWLVGLHAAGTVAVGDVDWHGIHAGLTLQLESSRGHWRAPSLAISLPQGTFAGSGSLEDARLHLAGVVAASHRLRLAALLQTTPFHGLLSGALAGSLRLQRPASGGGMDQIEASGDFDLLRGHLDAAGGPVAFESFAAAFHLAHGVADLTNVRWVNAAGRWQGQGSARFDASGLAGFDLRLHAGTRQLHLAASATARP